MNHKKTRIMINNYIKFLEIEILKLCDRLRDDVLPELGVLIEDLS